MTSSGHFPLMQFTATIFKESGSSLPPNDSAIIVAVIQIIGSSMSVFLIDRIGRRPIMLTSCFGTAASLSAIGAYSYLDKRGYNVESLNWIPIVGYSSGIFLLTMGMIGLPPTIITEVIPAEVF